MFSNLSNQIALKGAFKCLQYCIFICILGPRDEKLLEGIICKVFLV